MTTTADAHRIELLSDSESQTRQIGLRIGQTMRAGDVLTLDGPLGAGKTCLVRGLAEGLSINPAAVSSPTFIICQEYSRSDGSFTLAHIDAYRLSGPDELETIGWQELLASPETVLAVEWPSRIESALPALSSGRRVNVVLEHVGPCTRRLVIEGPDAVLNALRSQSLGTPTMPCRSCGAPVSAVAATFPFCSSRCRMADLNTWFNEGYRTSRAVQNDDELDV
jgi:tRNA threonylcarbamoyladenosine biosynthesis protein TsaE